jgi:hypothetical protein
VENNYSVCVITVEHEVPSRILMEHCMKRIKETIFLGNLNAVKTLLCFLYGVIDPWTPEMHAHFVCVHVKYLFIFVRFPSVSCYKTL